MNRSARHDANTPTAHLAEFVYRRLLLLYPRAFRTEFTPALVEAFHDRRRSRGATFWWYIFRDLAASVPQARREDAGLRGTPAPRSPKPPSSSRMMGFLNDLRAAARRLRRQPAFAVAAVMVIALGISGATTVFSVVNGVLLRELPYESPERIVRLWANLPEEGIRDFSFTKIEFRHFYDNNEVFDAIGGDFPTTLTVTGDGEAERLRSAFITPGYFEAFGMRPQLGRFIDFTDIDADRLDIVVISHGLWQRRLGSNPDVIGTTLILNDRAIEIVGVLPADYRHLDDDYDAFVPYTRGTGGWIGRWLGLSARLAPGVSLEQAQANIDSMMAAIAEEQERTSGWSVALQPVSNWAVGRTRASLLAILAAVGLLLLLACANVANLLLARASTRHRETAVRLALGASRGQIAQQHLAEGVVIGTAGGVAGTALAYVGVPFVVAAGASALPRLSTISVDTRVLAVSITMSVASGILFGMAPAVYAFRAARRGSFSPGGGGVVGRHGSQPALTALIVVEVALALAVLVGAGLFLRSFQQLRAVDIGADTDRVVSASLSLPGSRYGEATLVHAFFDELLGEVSGLPGVEAASLSAYMPLGGEGAVTSLTNADRLAAGSRERVATLQRIVRQDYFRTMGIPLLRGRNFDESDDLASARQLVVSESLADMFWPGEDPIGKRVTSRLQPEAEDWREIIGVVGDVRYVDLESPQQPQIYESHFERPSREMTLVARTALTPGAFAGLLRQRVAAIDPQVPISTVTSMEETARNAVAGPRFSVLVFAVFATVAVLLACAGIYGVVTFAVGRRRREIGLRMTLGATNSDIVSRTLVRAFAPVAVGLLLGVALAAALSRVLASALFEVSPLDPGAYVAGVVGLAAVGLLACWLPTRHATSIDPMEAMRND